MRTIKKGATSQSVYFDVLDSTSTTGGRKTGLAFNTSSLVAYYMRSQSTSTAITLATLAAANTAWSSGGFKEVDATNMPGIYRLDVPDAAFATGAGDDVVIVLKGATGMVQASCDVQLVAYDPQDTVRAGLTALPNAAAEAAGGIYTRGTGTGQINQDANGRIDVNGKAWAGGTIPAPNVTGVPIVDDKYLLGTVYSTPATAGIQDINVINWKGSAAAAMTGDAYARLGAPAGASVSADVAAVKVDTAAIKVQTDKVTFTVANQVDVNVIDWKSATAPAMTGDAYARIGAAGAGLTALGDTRIAHLDADVSTRSTYAGADTAGTTTLLSRLTSTRAGLLDHLDQDISSRMATFSYTAPDNASITAIKGKTDNLPPDPADASDIATALTSLASHGDTNWSTATGFSTIGAGDVWDVLLADHEGAGSMGQSLFYAQQGSTSADSKATDIFGDTQAIRGLTDTLVNTSGKLWVLDEAGDPLPHASDVSAIKTTTDKLDDTLEDNAGTFRFTATGLAQAPTGGSAPTAGEVAIAVWDEALSGHTTDGTAGKAVADTVSMAGTIEGRIGTPAFGDLAGDIAHAQGSIDGIGTSIGALNNLSAADVNAEVDTAIADAALATAAGLATTDGKVDAVKGKTDQLGFTGDGVSADLRSINGTTLTGDGSSGDKFGPA